MDTIIKKNNAKHAKVQNNNNFSVKLIGLIKEKKENIKNRFKLDKMHPFVLIGLKWVFFIIIFIIAISITIGVIKHRFNKRVEEEVEARVAVVVAEYEAKEQARINAEIAAAYAEQNSVQAEMQRNAEWKAKVLYGARNFESRYGYDERDLLTLCWCIDNRVNNPIYPSTIAEVIRQKDQWVGYFESNPVIDKYYQIALKSEEEKMNAVSPISSDYVFAHMTERGIFLSNTFGEDSQYGWWRHE